MIDRDVGFNAALQARSLANAVGHEHRIGAVPKFQLQEQVASLIASELRDVEITLRRATRSRYEVVNLLSERAAAMGGKRLRPMLVLLSALGSGRDLTARAHADLARTAASVELVHAASLVHDDVMDGAEERRHQATIVKQAGNANAVLLGDFLFTRAYALAAQTRNTRAAKLIAAAATELCEGELRQQASAGQWSLEMKEYKSILAQKTASLCAVSCRLGAMQAGADVQTQRVFHRYGRLLGLAFQIYDDWLDYWGTPRVGKTLGTDLTQRKVTLPLLLVLKDATQARSKEIVEQLQSGDAAAVSEVYEFVKSTSAGEQTLAVAQRLCRKAQEALLVLHPSQESARAAIECLNAIAYYSVSRGE